jgi:hypothetical protein
MGGYWYTWDLAEPSRITPIQQGEAHPEGNGQLIWCPSNPQLYITFTQVPGAKCGFRFYHATQPQVPKIYKAPPTGPIRSMSWHANDLYVIGASGQHLYLWDLA